jgi:hypothetical protein
MRHGATSWRTLALIALAGVAPVTAVVPAAPGILNMVAVHGARWRSAEWCCCKWATINGTSHTRNDGLAGVAPVTAVVPAAPGILNSTPPNHDSCHA